MGYLLSIKKNNRIKKQRFFKTFWQCYLFFIFLSTELKKKLQIHQMKKILLIGISISLIACNKSADVKELKTAYVDTSILMKEYTEAKDIEAKYKAKSEEKGRQLQAEISRFKEDAAFFQRNAQANGQAWAQEHGAELQKREQQLTYAQQALSQQLQQESGVEMDSLVNNVKKFIKSYGKEKGYAYIYGTGDAATVLYAEDKYDITKEVIKALNEKTKSTPKTAVKEEVKK